LLSSANVQNLILIERQKVAAPTGLEYDLTGYEMFQNERQQYLKTGWGILLAD